MLRTAAVSNIAQRLLTAVFPPSCPVCRDETGAPMALCPVCWRDLAFLGDNGCTTCGHPVPGCAGSEILQCDDCLHHPRTWSRGRAVFRYQDTGRKLVLALKHADRTDLAPMLADWAIRAGGSLIADADVIAPIPVHWLRRLSRRRNQAADLSRWISKRAGRRLAHMPGLLVRARATGNQDGKGRAARVENVRKAFRATKDLTGKRVLLVDDVLTTGATMDEAARMCTLAGARDVNILVLALVTRDDSPYMRPQQEDNGDETG